MSSLPSERAAILATIDPEAFTTSQTDSTDQVDFELFGSAMFCVLAGTIDATGGVTFTVHEAPESTTTAGSAHWTDETTMTGKAITALGATDDDKQAIINVKSAELLVTSRYARGKVTATTAGSDLAVVVLGFDPRFAPANDKDLSTVAEIVG